MNTNILAKVNGMAITAADIDAELAAMGPNGQQYNSPQGREALLEQLINKKLFLADAAKNLYEYDPVFKAELQKIKEDLLANFAITKAVENVKVTDDEAKKFYEENKDSMLSGETVNASHILVDTEEKANEILKDIKDGKVTFADAAKEHSSCPSSQNGGSLGEFGRGQMVPEFDQAVFSMEAGEIAGPVKTQFGYHLICLNSKNEAKEIAFEQISEQIKARLLNDKQRTAYTSKINQLKILYPVDRF